MSTRKAWLAVASVSVAALALSGCGSPSGGNGDATLTMWTYSDTGAEGLRAVAEKFKADTGISVEISVTSPREAYQTKIQAAARSKELPDLLTVGADAEQYTLAAAGITVDLTDNVDDAWRSAFLPGMIEASTLTQTAIDASASDSQNTLKDLTAGHIYAVPYLAGSSGVIVANKELLSAAGVNTDAGPASWEELVASVKATYTANPKSGGIINGLAVPEGAYQWLYRPMAAKYLGIEKLNALSSKTGYEAWTAPPAVQTLTFYDQLQPYWAPGVVSLDLGQADTAFAQGQAAWDVGGTYTIPALISQGMSFDNLLTFPVPAPKGSAQPDIGVSAIALLSAAVTSQSAHKDEAIRFAQYLTSAEGAAVWALAAKDVPATAVDVASIEAKDPLLASIIGSLSTDAATAFNPDDTSADPVQTPPVKSSVAREIAKLVTGDGTPQSVAEGIRATYAQAWATAK